MSSPVKLVLVSGFGFQDGKPLRESVSELKVGAP